MSGVPAVFLDRDGTLVEERDYPVRAEDLVVLPGVPAALARLGSAGFLRVVLTNQSAVARGMIDEERLAALQDDLFDRLARAGGGIDRAYYCPHHPEGRVAGYAMRCRCRKPAPGLLELAVATDDIDLERSCFVGDSPRDLFPDAGPAGPRLLVRTGHPIGDEGAADAVVDDLPAAVDRILAWHLDTAARARDA